MKNINKYSKFWMESEFDSNEIFTTLVDGELDLSIGGLLKLASLKRSFAGFSKIICERDIPIVFINSNDLSFTDGEKLYVCAIVEENGYDSTVGLILHESAHILLSDFSVLNNIKILIPGRLSKIAHNIGMTDASIITCMSDIYGWIEDRRIDNYIITTCPGYSGYYTALYDRYFNSDEITKILISDAYRTEVYHSYMFRIINLINKYSDLKALRGLNEIYNIIDLSNINRLKNSIDSFNVACEVFNIIINNIDELTPEDNANINKNEQKESSVVQCGINISGGDKNSDKNKIELSKEELDKLLNDIANQKIFINLNYRESKLDSNVDNIINIGEIENIDAHIVPVKIDSKLRNKFKHEIYKYDSIYDGSKYNVIVMNNISESMFLPDIVPFALNENEIDNDTESAVNSGIVLGRRIADKLVVRNDETIIEYNRKNSGKIDRRLLSDLGYGSESIFKTLFVERYTNAILHISIDVSGSMANGNRFNNAIKIVSGICQAASMLNGNLNIVVSLRGTAFSDEPLIAIIYDSRVDTMFKVKRIFPRINANGGTPEGLCYAAMSDLIESASPTLDSYFLNLSDGEPSYFNYSGELAAEHTRLEVEKMRARGIKVLSYFISSSDTFNTEFKLMYGKSAEFIDTDNMIDIVRTLNKLFLNKN